MNLKSEKEIKIKILLIMPNADMHKLYIGSHVRSMREAPLTLTTLAALTGDDSSIEYKLIDESIDRVPLDETPDLVGISVLTGTAPRAYALADHFRQKNIPVVLGGVHVTLLPDEARQYGDSIVIGMAEFTWPQLVKDFRSGNLQKEYVAKESEGQKFYTNIPTPRWDLLRKSGYMMPYSIQCTRGCMHKCDFCSVPGVWEHFQRRPVGDVIRDIKALPSRRFVINDVSPFDDIEYAKEFLRALIPLRKKWGGLATSKITKDPELFDLLVRSGCQYLLIGFESVNQKILNRIAKGFNRENHYGELMRQLRKAGIIVQGCFVFGFDDDDLDVFPRTVERVQELRVDIPRYSIYTPYPGSRLFKRLEEEQRILSYDWAKYDTMHVVYRPKLLTPVELADGLVWAYRNTFKISNIFQRTFGSGTRFPITFMGNLTYRLFVKRLHRGKGFEMPVTVRGINSAKGDAK